MPLTEHDYDEFERLFTQEHLTLEEIGAYYGVTREWVRQKLAQRGIDTRANIRWRGEQRRLHEQVHECWICGEQYMNGQGGRHVTRHLYGQHEEEIARAYLAGEHPRTIAARVGISYGAVYRWLHRSGVFRRTKIPQASTRAESHAREAKILELRVQGVPSSEIARQIGVTTNRVHQVLRKAGL